MSRRKISLLIASGVVLAAAVVGVVVIIAESSSSSAALQPPSVAPAARSQFPSPPRGSVVYAREDRMDALALAVVPQAHGVSLQASVVGDQGAGVRGLSVSFAVGARGRSYTMRASPCGAGCYGASVTLPSRPLRVRVRVVRPARTTTWNVQLPATWPARDASAIVARATRVWTHLHTLSYLDRLGSSPRDVVIAHWQIVAPDRLAYQIDRGSQAIIIGPRRWDRPSGGSGAKWQSSTALRLHQPEPFWVSATDAHVLGASRFDGHAVWRISFFDPRTPAWFLVLVDRTTLRTLDLHMTATAHFMHDTYGLFNAPIKIAPPNH
jgi:hypothetical protein